MKQTHNKTDQSYEEQRALYAIPSWTSLSVRDVEKLVRAYESNVVEELNGIVEDVVRDSSSRQPVCPYQTDLFE